MEGGPPSFPQGFTCLVVLRIPVRAGSRTPYWTLTICGGAFQPLGVWVRAPVAGPTTPVARLSGWFGLFPVRSPLLRESRLISLRRATEMFQFAHCPPACLLYSAGGVQTSLWTGCPIRNLRAHRSHAAPPERFAGLRVLHRSSAPRHPPRTLSNLFVICSLLLFLASLPCYAPL